MPPSDAETAHLVGWSVAAVGVAIAALAVILGARVRTARAAHGVVLAGCLLVTAGIANASFVLLRGLARLEQTTGDEETKSAALTAFLARAMPPANLDLVIGVALVCAGAWLRATAKPSDGRGERGSS